MTTPTRCKVMGILNVTTDSFSDGGQFLLVPNALAHADSMLAAGADIIDIGGESTRPGAERVDADTEKQRVLPVVEDLASRGVAVSVDTMRADVAAESVARGATLINDVSGGLADPEMYSVMADARVDVCLMHWQADTFGNAAGAAHQPGHVVDDVRRGLDDLVTRATNAGVDPHRIILDPGLGFAKTAADNWELLNALPEFVNSGFRILIGASRKRFLQAIRDERGAEPAPDIATTALTALCAHHGAWAVRVHNVADNVDATTVAHRMATGKE
ncbi:dihydropteroate synthase [Corynebacterium aquilae]|uniref:Dihydropteroate synthase n=1 Tax=Corynebacterium aquilae DSM 44791 TaxID=1431546 RepID=A0A1L7CI42_9CORY|nr:dihydropteroate synthase [Corynebacterium aquilae]APT85498.1 dihydropteroate synthase [Corynebacterium aquilae DSM 44791]